MYVVLYVVLYVALYVVLYVALYVVLYVVFYVVFLLYCVRSMFRKYVIASKATMGETNIYPSCFLKKFTIFRKDQNVKKSMFFFKKKFQKTVRSGRENSR